MRLDPDIDKEFNHEVSQRETIGYALGRKSTDPESLESLGIGPLPS